MLIAEGEIEVDGEKVQLEFYLGGDYKVWVLNACDIFGMNNMPKILYNFQPLAKAINK